MPAMAAVAHTILFLFLILGSNGAAEAARTFSFSNGCSHPVWVGALNGATSPPLARSGFFLASGAASALDAPEDAAWSGTFWARTGCATDAATGRFSCATADCGSGDVSCDGRGPSPPVTLVELTLAAVSFGGQDFYDVSLVDGFNVPVRITPTTNTSSSNGSNGGCRAASCAGDVNAACPADLRVVVSGSGVVACKSACGAYGSARFCCSGEYGTPAACGPTSYSEAFKSACPDAYSYAYDDATSTFTCAGASGYHIAFCPS